MSLSQRLSTPLDEDAIVSTPKPGAPGLVAIAEDLLAFARQEAREGFAAHDSIRIRDAAEKAWNAAVQATDFCMRAHGRPPTPGPEAHSDRHEFLESIGREDLETEYTFFADRLHGSCFYGGRLPHEEVANRWLERVGRFIDQIKAGV